jgi:hypothetical protein
MHLQVQDIVKGGIGRISLNKKRGGNTQGVQEGGYRFFHKIIYSELGMHSLQ